MEGMGWLGRVGSDRIPLGAEAIVVAKMVSPRVALAQTPGAVVVTITTTSLAACAWAPGLYRAKLQFAHFQGGGWLSVFYRG